MGTFIKKFTERAKAESSPVVQLDDLTKKKRNGFFWVSGNWNDMERGDTFYPDWAWHSYPISHHER